MTEAQHRSLPSRVTPETVRQLPFLAYLLMGMTLLGMAIVSPSAGATGGDSCVPFQKQVSVDGGATWHDANDLATAPRKLPGGGNRYRFIIANCETSRNLVDTRVRDEDLGIVDPFNANGVLVGNGIIAPGDVVVVTKSDPGFEKLDLPGQCVTKNRATETTFIDGNPVALSFPDRAIVDCTPRPAIDIEKFTNGVDADEPGAGDAPQVAAGGVVTWSYLVTNVGDVALANVMVEDDQIGLIACPQDTLDVGESMQCNVSGSAEDLETTSFHTVAGVCGSIPNRPLYQNRGTATGTDMATGEVVIDVDPSHYCNPEEPAIDIEKATNGVDADDPGAGDAPQVAAGDLVTWSYVVTNTGTVPLVGVAAFDETLGIGLNCPQADLAPAESMICDAVVGFAVDLSHGDSNVVEGICGSIPNAPLYENIARVTAASEGGTFVQDSDPSHYCNAPPPPECGLSVQKGCAILPPPAPSGKCDGKLQQFTMVWDGIDGIQVSGPANDAPGGIVNQGDVVTFFGPFSNNDVLVDIAGLGTSKFHVSCSDQDMDGDTSTNEDQQQVSAAGRDCGKLQGDGKGSDGINQWLLEGFVDNSGTALACSPPSGEPLVAACEFYATPVDCDTVGKPEVITLRYIGGACPGGNSQGSKSGCSGSVDATLPVTVTLDGGSLGPIAPGDSFDVLTTGSNTTVILSNAGGTQVNDVHTSCSAPLVAGETFGNMELVALDGQGLGAEVTYQYLISNNGSETVSNITAVDDRLGIVPGSPLTSLLPGESATLSATAFVTETVTNTVDVDGYVASGASCLVSASATVTAMGPPPCDVSIVLDKIEDKKIKWKLSNHSAGRTATIESLTVSWPGSESLKKINFDGADILKDDPRLPPSATVLDNEWLKEVKDRRLDVGDSGKKLEVEFTDNFPLKDDQPATDFAVTVTFAEGCSVTFSP